MSVLRTTIRRPGGYDRLEFETVPSRAPRAGEVRVRVEAIGVNYADCVTRMGLYASARKYVGYPITPGFEVAGRIDAVGPEVRGVTVGDPVLAVTRFFGYATEVVVPETQVRRRPDGVDAVRGAALPVAFFTAWYGLHVLGAVRTGHRVLVHSAAGGVGGMLVTLAHQAGARVLGVVGAPEKEGTARALGADQVVLRRPGWARAARSWAGRGFDVVLDATGVATLRDSYRLLAPAGRLVVYGFHSMLPRGRGRPNLLALAWHALRTPRFSPLAMTGDNRSVMAFNLSYLFGRQDLLSEGFDRLLEAARRGRCLHQPVTTIPFREVARAHRLLESGRTVGKLVLVTDGSGACP